MFRLVIAVIFLNINLCRTQMPPLDALRLYASQLGMTIPVSLASGAARFAGPLDSPNCNFRCPYGTVQAPRPGYISKANGCGSYGLETMNIPELIPFVDCCNEHDICYDTCGAIKYACDFQFQTCLRNRCGMLMRHYRFSQFRGNMRIPPEAISQCMSTAEIAGAAPVVAGCNAFTVAQRNSCVCVPPSALVPPTSL